AIADNREKNGLRNGPKRADVLMLECYPIPRRGQSLKEPLTRAPCRMAAPVANTLARLCVGSPASGSRAPLQNIVQNRCQLLRAPGDCFDRRVQSAELGVHDLGQIIHSCPLSDFTQIDMDGSQSLEPVLPGSEHGHQNAVP